MASLVEGEVLMSGNGSDPFFALTKSLCLSKNSKEHKYIYRVIKCHFEHLKDRFFSNGR